MLYCDDADADLVFPEWLVDVDSWCDGRDGG